LLRNLEQHLVSRLDCGLTTELQPPDYATRLAILRKKAETLQVVLAEEVFAFLAEHVRTNVRRLEGALMRVAAYQSLIGRGISRETMEQLLRDTLREEAGKTLTIDRIQKKVAEYFEVRIADMTGKRRTSDIVFPRRWRCIWLGATQRPPSTRLEKPSGAAITEQFCTPVKLFLLG
jgi:chromosomal replication initiator protein